MSASHNRQILDILLTDNTFNLWTKPGTGLVWVGKCFYCRTKLMVSPSGEALGDVTIEHILARNQGGDDSLMNLALSCKSCNQEKGSRHDAKRKKINTDLLEQSKTERLKRWRDKP